MGDVELTLEETNKLRLSLGLKPLADPAAPLAEGEEPELDPEQVAEANYTRRREEDAKAAETKLLQERINKARNKRELAAKLTGSTLGDQPTEDAAAWAKKARRRAKELAAERALVAKREQEQLELDELGRADLYSEKDLSGIKVSHALDDFEEGEHILTLKDGRVLDGEEDELENEDLERLSRDAKGKELKKKQSGYSGYDDDEFDEGRVGMKKKVLSKYDVDIDGEADTGFRLGGTVAPKAKRPADELEQIGDDSVNRTLLSGGLAYEKNQEVSDYLQEGDAGFKKPKKKKKRSTRVVEVDEERAPAVKVEADGMDVDGPVASSSRLPTPPPAVENYVDDDELQSALARQRRQKSRKTAKLSPEEIARQLAEQKAEEEASAAVARASQAAAAKVEEDDDQIQFNETSTFARAVQMPPVVQVIRTSAAEPVNAVASSSRVKTEATDVNLDSLMAQDQDVKMEDDDEPEEEVDEQLAEMALRQGLSIEEMRIKLDADLAKAEQEDDVEIGTASEAVVGKGLAGALALLKSTGNLDTNAPADARERERIQKEKDLWLADRRRRLAQRELERIQARGGNKDQATLEYDKRMREQREAADAVEAFRNYKPDVNIVYHDEFGREMTPKEAWKALSHRFHGKGSGKGKTEKRLEKIKLEKKREAMSMGDTSLSKNFNERASRTGEAFMILSSGNKATVTESQPGKKRK